MAEKAELVITALQQRIGEVVSNYETQIAFLRAEITKRVNGGTIGLADRIKHFKEYYHLLA